MNGLTFENPGPRTNNHLEGWHGSLRRAVGIAHPNVYAFTEAIKKQQKIFELKLLQLSSNGVVSQPKTQYARMEKALARAIDDYCDEEITITGFLDIAGRAIHLS